VEYSSGLVAMPSVDDESSIGFWLSAVQQEFQKNAPDLLSLFLIYAEDAKFGYSYISSDLTSLPQHAKILEVGAGSLLLSCQLIREGFDVTSLEPIGSGFSHFDEMRNRVLKVAGDFEIVPYILDAKAEVLTIQDYFDYAFSVNVMEHVDDVALVLERVGDSLSKNAAYRFTCPNYTFPYEPHFNIPIFINKRLTEKLFYKKIFEHGMSDPRGTWASLNWITVSSIKKAIKPSLVLNSMFRRSMIVNMFSRINTDHEFANRRSPVMVSIIRTIVFLRLHFLFSAIPISLQPVMDCIIVKCNISEDV
jgi:SAM-dependent methyltransferase